MKAKRGLQEFIDRANEFDKRWIVRLINSKDPGPLKFRLLHQTLRKWRCSESVKHLIELGADPLKTEKVSGDTALHVAVYVNAKADIIEALLHVNKDECTKAPEPCCCGIQAIRESNNKCQYPEDLISISSSVRQILLTEGKCSVLLIRLYYITITYTTK